MLTPLHDERQYLCPGEAAPVSRAVHLGRLAASFAACRQCPHRRDVNAWLPPSVSEPIEPPPERTRELTRAAHGFRGRYGDPLDRRAAMHWASALASALWDHRILAADDVLANQTAPTLIVGYDERSGSPDLFTGVMQGLVRMSCRVIDVGLTTEPCLRFAVRQFAADAGLIITGAGCEPAWIGLDVFRQYGLPTETEFYDRWQAATNSPISRPSRMPGDLIADRVMERYEANLAGCFHAVRPLSIICGVASRQMTPRLENLFARLPGRSELMSLPVRRRDLANPLDADIQQIGRRVRETQADLGILIDDDASACGVLDERGKLVESFAWQQRLCENLLCDNPGGAIVLDTNVWDHLAPAVTSAGGRPILVASADRAARLMFESGLAAFGTDGRVWFGGDVPTCDAVHTLAAVWQALSRSDMPASEVLA